MLRSTHAPRATRALVVSLFASAVGCRATSTSPRGGVVAIAPVEARSPTPSKPKVEPPAPVDPETADWGSPCAEHSPEHQHATAELASLTTAIEALPPTGDPKPLVARLGALLQTPCFEIANEIVPVEDLKSALALKTFWREGGESWFAAPLAWGKGGDRWLWTPPSIRDALTTENGKGHPLAALLCPAAVALPNGMAPSACGFEAEGFQLRATNALHRAAEVERAAFLDQSPPPEPPATYDSCLATAQAGPKDRAFATLTECVHGAELRGDALPLGRFRVPHDGWLILRGRRGHYASCEEIRAYDLATGAATVASTCTSMSQPGRTRIQVTTGTLPLSALREAAWMMFLANVAQHGIVTYGYGRAIPDDMTIRAPKGQVFGVGMSFGMSSGRTTLAYQWVRGGRSVATGTVSWPDAWYGADQHATELLAIAEAGFVPGCTRAKLPTIPWAARSDPKTRVIDAKGFFPTYDDALYTDLETAIARQATSAKLCP